VANAPPIPSAAVPEPLRAVRSDVKRGLARYAEWLEKYIQHAVIGLEGISKKSGFESWEGWGGRLRHSVDGYDAAHRTASEWLSDFGRLLVECHRSSLAEHRRGLDKPMRRVRGEGSEEESDGSSGSEGGEFADGFRLAAERFARQSALGLFEIRPPPRMPRQKSSQEVAAARAALEQLCALVGRFALACGECMEKLEQRDHLRRGHLHEAIAQMEEASARSTRHIVKGERDALAATRRAIEEVTRQRVVRTELDAVLAWLVQSADAQIQSARAVFETQRLELEQQVRRLANDLQAATNALEEKDRLLQSLRVEHAAHLAQQKAMLE
jgi:hypothetical protein